MKKTKYKTKGKSLVEKAIERAVLNAVGLLSRKGTDKLFKKVEEKVKNTKVASQTKKAPAEDVPDPTVEQNVPESDITID
jgi:hypothetical protein